MKKLSLGVSLCVLATLLVSTGCDRAKTRKKKENLDPPAELTDFAATVSVKEIWSVDSGDGVGQTGGAPRATIAGDRVILVDAENGVQVVSLDSGKSVWRNELEDDGIIAGAGVGEDLVVVGTINGDVIAMAANSGDEKWRAKISSETLAAPAIADGVVVVRSNDGRLYGFDASNGARKWVFDRNLPTITLRGNGTPIIESGRVFIGYDNGKVYGLDLLDGSVKWEQTLATGEGRFELDRMNDVDGDLAYASGVLYAAAYNGRVTAIQPETGRAIWDRDLSSHGGVGSDGFKVVVADVKGAMNAMEASTGASVWRNDVLHHRWLSTPALVGKYAVVGDFEGVVHWFDLEDGKLAARADLGGDSAIRGTPQVSGNIVVVSTVDGETAAYRVGD